MFSTSHRLPWQAGVLACAAALLLPAFAAAQEPSAPASILAAQPLTAAQIVNQMERHNQVRASDLKHYQSLRHYEVEYKGFSATLDAKMVVEANYDAVSGKTFRIVSLTGSSLLGNKVLKRLLDTEKEATGDQKATALSAANYRFTLEKVENVRDRPAYVLDVEPRTDNKLLYRGKIWVDATDFAVAKIEASPAQNPSFWIASTAIHHCYSKTDGFWLPEHNLSETKVRIGGKAVLTIDYGTYQVVAETAPMVGGAQ